ncbi:hemolysin family protein [Nakamurella sp.]|uniref:hemolysin family protein n=1 Tax=Nakamurella sp. TaxID=1869182 RepID=UPI0037852A70
MSGTGWAIVATIALIALSAFFVAVEFALLAARRHRLADAAPRSRSARAALRSSAELTVVLAGSQLGITACTLALGAVTKPAVQDLVAGPLTALNLSLWLADAAAFVLSLLIVTFLHLVIGEMAPKSWAIAHPERSAILLALPMRAFMWLFRPMLIALNSWANACVRLVGVQPVEELASGQNPQTLRQLVEHSADVGTLGADYSRRLATALDLPALTIGALVRTDVRPTQVHPEATVQDVRRAARDSGHLRILVGDGPHITGIVHVRDTLVADPDAPLHDFVRPSFDLAAATPFAQGLEAMRRDRAHLAVVHDDKGRSLGVVTLADLLRTLFPETATPRAGR